MAARDYKILCGHTSAYIAKPAKIVGCKHPKFMSGDRREISEEEILALIDWYINSEIDCAEDAIVLKSEERPGYSLVLKLEPEEEFSEDPEDSFEE